MSDKPVVGTPDVREALFKNITEMLMRDFGYINQPHDTILKIALALSPAIQPLIEAAEKRGAEKERAKVTAEEEAREAGEFIQIINRYEDGD